MLCPSCHTQNRDSARFCKGCGMPLGDEQVQQVQQQPAAQAPVVASDTPATTSPASPASVPEQPSAQQAGQTVQAPPSPELPVQEEPAIAQDTENTANDASLEPTQRLGQQEMQVYRSHWEQEQGRLQQSGQPTILPARDIADLPTVHFPLSEHESAQNNAPDIADEPTVQTPPVQQNTEDNASFVETTAEPGVAPAEPSHVEAPTPAAQEAEAEPHEPHEPQAPQEQQPQTADDEQPSAQAMATGPEPDAATGDEAAPREEPTQEENVMEEQATPTESQEQASGSEGSQGFPTLAVGTTLNDGRYEISEIVQFEGAEGAEGTAEGQEQEHVYQVVDHQGYQHCWNCGSEQNTEGDEFCIDCGAGLVNAPYLMYEYPASEQTESEARVLSGTIVNTFVEQGHTYVIEQQQAEELVFPNGVHLVAACDSDAGNVRRAEPNEDSPFVLQFERVHESVASTVGLFIVADGMGGHDNGQLASRTTIGVIAERVTRELLLPPLSAEKAQEQQPVHDEDMLVGLIHGSIEDANTTLCQINQRDKTDMGSTLTGCMLVEHMAYIFNVGDSRTYILREGTIHKLTTDHSLVGQLVAGGLIEPDDVYTHPQRNQIFRSIGDKLNVQIDVFKQQVYPGDILLSCSDGLWEMVRDPQITEILTHAPDPQTACTQLIEAANENGGEDNISAVAVYVR